METINYDILLRLLVAHIIGDFILQREDWVKNKNKDKIKSVHLYLHCLIHGILVYVFLFKFNSFLIPIIIILSHFIIDTLKIYFGKEKRFTFLIDQLLHIAVILFLWIFKTEQQDQIYNFILSVFSKSHFWLIITSYLFISNPTSVIIAEFIKKWKDSIKNEDSLEDAGKWIGYFERFLVLTFIITDHYEAIGFLLAAKSVFRFGDLKECKEIKFTEYVLVGTLTSFSIAIIVGIILKKLMT